MEICGGITLISADSNERQPTMPEDDPPPRGYKAQTVPLSRTFVDMPCWACVRPEPRQSTVGTKEEPAYTGRLE